MRIDELKELVKNGSIKELHTSYKRGYVSRKSKGIISVYNGRFGSGFVFDSPCYHSTQYHFRSYFVFPQGELKNA